MSRPNPKAAILAMAEDDELQPLEGVEGAFIRRLSMGEMVKLSTIENDSGPHLLAMAICNSEGQPLFTEKEAAQLAKIKVDKFRKLADQVTKFNRMDDGAGNEAIKN